MHGTVCGGARAAQGGRRWRAVVLAAWLEQHIIRKTLHIALLQAARVATRHEQWRDWPLTRRRSGALPLAQRANAWRVAGRARPGQGVRL